MTDTPPDWVLIMAARSCGWHHDHTAKNLRPALKHNDAFRALCNMILKHEQPPVDRKLLCVEEAMCEFGWDKYWKGRGACYRAIELWEEGFGK